MLALMLLGVLPLSECFAPGAVAGWAQGRGFRRPDSARDLLSNGLTDGFVECGTARRPATKKGGPGGLLSICMA